MLLWSVSLVHFKPGGQGKNGYIFPYIFLWKVFYSKSLFIKAYNSQKTSWNNSNTVLVIQRWGLVVTEYKKPAKSLLSALKWMSISKISTQKYGSGHFDPFLITRKIRPIGGRIRNHSDQSEHVLRILKLYFCLFQKNEIMCSNFFFRFCNLLLGKTHIKKSVFF